MRILTHVLGGALFAFGLVLSGMTQPSKVVAFLDVGGNWDPSLAFVMLGAILVHSVFYRVIVKRSSPVFAGTFETPTRSVIDAKLVGGSVLFGIGWGLSGFCPGPAISSVVTLAPNTLVFLASLSVTMVVYGFVVSRLMPSEKPSSDADEPDESDPPGGIALSGRPSPSL